MISKKYFKIVHFFQLYFHLDMYSQKAYKRKRKYLFFQNSISTKKISLSREELYISFNYQVESIKIFKHE